MSVVSVRVKPGSKKGPLVQPALDGSLLIFVREPAFEGKANSAVAHALAGYFDVPYTNVQMISGRTSRIKRFEIKGI